MENIIILKAKEGYTFKRISDDFIMGSVIYIINPDNDNSSEKYEEIIDINYVPDPREY